MCSGKKKINIIFILEEKQNGFYCYMYVMYNEIQ